MLQECHRSVTNTLAPTPLARACGIALGTAALVQLAAPPAAAQRAARLEEVTVTAEFREANVQDTPVAMTAVNSEMLEARSQTNIMDVSAQAPNVTLTPMGQDSGSAMGAFIRGVGQTDFNYALEPGVGMYVDDVYYPNLTGSMIELIDIQRVEILRGPQGTLAGRNSIGGAVKLYSMEPGDATGTGSARLTVGDYGRVGIRGAADMNLIEDTLDLRIAGVSRNRDGYVNRLDYQCVNANAGNPTDIPSYSNGQLDTCQLGTFGGESFTGGRATLLWTPTNDLEFKLIGDAVSEDSDPGAQVLIGVNEELARNSGTADLTEEGIELQGSFIDVDGDLDTTADREYYDNRFVTHGQFRQPDAVLNDPYVSYATFLDPMPSQPTRPFSPVNIDPRNVFDQRGFSFHMDWNITDQVSMLWISAFREYENTWTEDTDHSPVNSQMLTQGLRHSHKTHEVRFNGTSFNQSVDWTIGGFYVDQYRAELFANVNLHYSDLNFIHGPDLTPSTSEALFAHADWHLNDRLNLKLGVRASEDEKDYVYLRSNPDGTVPEPCTIPGPPALRGNPPNCALAPLGAETFADRDRASFSSSRTDYRVALDYAINDDVMLYGQVSTGYKVGGINPRPFFEIQIESFGEEELTSNEIGLKSTLADGVVQLNAALFSNDYSDIQLTQDACELPPALGGFGSPCLQPANVGSADVEGAEVELRVAPTDRLSFDMSASVLDFQYTQVAENVAVTLDMITPYTPEETTSLGVQYEWPLAAGGSFGFRIDSSYQGEVFTDAINAPTNRIDSYTVTNARLMWGSASGEWEADFEVTNLTDEVYFRNIFDQFTTSGQIAGGIAPPRMYAFHIERTFEL